MSPQLSSIKKKKIADGNILVSNLEQSLQTMWHEWQWCLCSPRGHWGGSLEGGWSKLFLDASDLVALWQQELGDLCLQLCFFHLWSSSSEVLLYATGSHQMFLISYMMTQWQLHWRGLMLTEWKGATLGKNREDIAKI